MKRIIFFIVLLFTFLGLKAGNENYSVGAGPAGMANASNMFPGIWSTYHNQAGLGNVENLTAGFNFENRFGLSELGVQSFALGVPTSSGTFGFSVTRFGYSAYNENKIGLGFGKKFGDKVSGGVQFDYFFLHLPEEYGNKGAFVAEAGIIAELVDNLFIGVHVFNPTRTKIADFNDERIPTIMRLGLGYVFTEKLILGIETEKTLDYNARFKAGLEYSVVDNLILRTGIATNQNQFFFGAGYKFKKLQADIAFSTNPYLPMSSHISLVYTFN